MEIYFKKGLILHKFFSYGVDNKVYVNEAIVDDNHTISDTSEPYFRAKNFQRPFIEGVDLGKHFHQHLKTIEDKKEILIKLIEYIFAKYSLPNGKIDNTLYDCHLSNFIMDNDGNFHFIDDEFVSPEPLEKRYIVDCLLKDIVNPKTNNEIREYFGFPQIKISAKNEKDKLTELRKKYFS